LYQKSIGDLNKNQRLSSFEIRLKRLLRYAAMWKAVVLLDEADVFLEGRSDEPGVNTEHNALVAVFLKHLEYFAGIVFLTSNRVKVFDKAMKSRIHLALEYGQPTPEMRRRIWSHYLMTTVPEAECGLDIDEDVDYFVQDELNGREIANCVNTALTLARFDKRKLKVDDVQAVLETRKEFEKTIHRAQQSRKQSMPVETRQLSLGRRNTLEALDE
jgi:SpoVK/Ycf46/Vps4 family AAA+-type ATPase